MQVEAEAQQRHEHGGGQRQGLAQTECAAIVGAFGVGQQFTGRLGAAVLVVLGGQGAGGALGIQFIQALLVQGDVEGGTVFLGLGLAATQHGNQQEGQGDQQKQAGGEPEIDHGSFLSWFSELSSASRRACSSAESITWPGLFSTRRRRTTMMPSTTRPPTSRPAGPYQSSRVRALTGGL
ncbi:hypothetical protein D3C71_1675650 [compost metagenome]